MIQEERITALNPTKKVRQGRYVLYWMQAAQRTHINHALEYAIYQANKLNIPLLTFFGLTPHFPDSNQRHYMFLLEGLKDILSSLHKRGIQLIIHQGSPEKSIMDLVDDAALVIVDRGYLRIQRHWRHMVAQNIDCPLIQVESDAIIPVEITSSKEEYSAATIRAKIKKILPRFLQPLTPRKTFHSSTSLDIPTFDIQDTAQALQHLNTDTSVTPVPNLHGGPNEAQKHFTTFITKKLDTYHLRKNDPSLDSLSLMSPYLHFGHISPLYIALQVLSRNSPGAQTYLEELIIRRELSINFVFYNPSYDTYTGLPTWAQNTLHEHSKDTRNYLYTLNELEKGTTHDPYWNAAQTEMIKTGKMHGYMRMYWGKKVIEWSKTPQKAYTTLLYLNNKYELDGRDPNGYAGVAWCFGKHDRPWPERPIFGKIRYMNAQGLKRKFDMKKYIEKINNL